MVSLAVILGTIAIILSAPVLFHFTYPSGGDDGALYLKQVLNNELTHNYGTLILTLLLKVGIVPLQALSIMYYSIISISTVIVFLTLKRYSLKAAIIGTPLVLLGNWGVWKLWFDGSIFALGGLLIFNLGAYWCIDKLELSLGKPQWLFFFALFMVFGMVFHKTSGIYILATVLIYSILNINLALGLATLIAGAGGLILWQGDNDLINSILANLPPLVFAVLGASLFILILIWTRREYKKYRDWFYNLRPLTQLLLILLFVLAMGMIVSDTYGKRMVIDMIAIGCILIAVLMSKMLVYMPDRYRNAALIAMLFVPLLLSVPDRWISNYTAMPAKDMETIDYINKLAISRGGLTLATTSGESPFILQFYLNDKVNLTTDINRAEAIIVSQSRRLFQQSHGVSPNADKFLFSNLSSQVVIK